MLIPSHMIYTICPLCSTCLVHVSTFHVHHLDYVIWPLGKVLKSLLRLSLHTHEGMCIQGCRDWHFQHVCCYIKTIQPQFIPNVVIAWKHRSLVIFVFTKKLKGLYLVAPRLTVSSWKTDFRHILVLVALYCSCAERLKLDCVIVLLPSQPLPPNFKQVKLELLTTRTAHNLPVFVC